MCCLFCVLLSPRPTVFEHIAWFFEKVKGEVHVWIVWVPKPRGKLLPALAHSCLDCTDSPGSRENCTRSRRRAWKDRERCHYPADKHWGGGGGGGREGRYTCDTGSVSGVSDPQTAGGMDARSLVGGETAECRKHECSVLDILKDIQNLVERSHIINVSRNCCILRSERAQTLKDCHLPR